MHHALCTMHHAPCTLHMHHALCTLHMHHAHLPHAALHLCTLNLAPWHCTRHTHTQQFAHATWGGVVSYGAFPAKVRTFSPTSVRQTLFRMLFWSSCLGIYARRMSTKTMGAIDYCMLPHYQLAQSIRSQLHIWRRHSESNCTMFDTHKWSNVVNFNNVNILSIHQHCDFMSVCRMSKYVVITRKIATFMVCHSSSSRSSCSWAPADRHCTVG